VRGRRNDGGWSWSCRRAAWGEGKARGTVGWAGGVGSTVQCSHGRGERRRLYFGDFLWGRLGGRQLDARALLEDVWPET
jgi:hypothetical protein